MFSFLALVFLMLAMLASTRESLPGGRDNWAGGLAIAMIASMIIGSLAWVF